MNAAIWLWILLVMHPHNPRTMRIVEEYDDVRTAAKAMAEGHSLMNEQEKRRAKQVKNREVNALIKLCEDNDIRIVTIEDSEYPPLLRTISDPPVVLFVRGVLSHGGISVAVVGTREASEYGKMATKRVCDGLVATGASIISGLAVGLDTVAHRCALDGGGYTIGVLACGHLVDYPKESAELKEDILKAGGALISELLPHTESRASYFHFRNRLMSGLCIATLVTEAPIRSGCLLTADHAVEQERLLFCIPPHDISRIEYAGVIRYLRNGAIPCFSHLDIINASPSLSQRIDMEKLKSSIDDIERFIMREEVLRQAGISRKNKKYDEPSQEKFDKPSERSSKKSEDTEEPQNTTVEITEALLQSLDEHSAELLKLIGEMPRSIDDLIELTGMAYFDVTTALTDMEIAGHITLNVDGTYCLQ